MAFTTGNQQLGHNPGRVRSRKRSCSFQALLLSHPHHYTERQSHCEHIPAIPTFAHLFSSGDFLEAITGTFPFKIKYQGMVSQKSLAGSEYKSKYLMLTDICNICTHYRSWDVKSSFTIWWRHQVFLMPQYSSVAIQILNPPSDRRCHVPICIPFWSLPRFLICLWISGCSWEP